MKVDNGKSCCIYGLYGITPDLADTATLLTRTERALKGGARLIQYRNKTANAHLRRHQAKLLLQLCRSHGVPMIVNDHVELAMDIGADGVHVGQLDTAVAETRKQLGDNKIIGASCYNNLEHAVAAEKDGADYVAFGAFYPTTTKRDTVTAPIELVSKAKNILTVPVVAIGGINTTNAAPLIENGVDALAISHALFEASDIHFAAATFSQFFARSLSVNSNRSEENPF